MVRSCQHIKSGKKFAVKVIDKVKLGPKKMEMVEMEIKIMQRVGAHPNVISLAEIFETNEKMNLVMELITGGELFDKIVQLHHYTEKDASRVVQQILKACLHLHENGICHRDLKPENLLLESDSLDAAVKLGDFGLSAFIVPGKKLTKAVGTPGYIAPEILQTLDGDLDGYGKEVDMWSVGVIMYILLCGFPPFYAEDDNEAFDLIIAGNYSYPAKYWDKISAAAKDLIDHLLVVDPTKRFTARQALDHPWTVSNDRSTHLGDTLTELKKFNARRHWRRGIHTIMAVGRMRSLLQAKEHPVEADLLASSSLSAELNAMLL